MNIEAEAELKKIKDEILNCKKCPLFEERVKNKYYPVIGAGNHEASIVFIGEAPGLNEAKTGKPFCGMAGKILDELLQSVDIKREDIYITNILKDRPPGNRDPRPEEISACLPYLKRQIKIIKPKVICSLGRYAMNFLMENFELADQIDQISNIHGKVFTTNDLFQNVIIIPFYHPAAVIYNRSLKNTLLQDFKILEKFK
ncbi:MAG: uracil-DNA glycosylase [Patescibacteria group bacterium]|nr:uracil-DNA glycosylase [Patescibacteria group bacterium]